MFQITETAASHARQLIEKNEQLSSTLRLKMTIENAGCAGTKYGIQLTNVLNKRDLIKKRYDLEIIIPEDYYQYFEDVTVDLDENNKFKITLDEKDKPTKTI
jgi:iron-sulfur cluster assembly accessory protein